MATLAHSKITDDGNRVLIIFTWAVTVFGEKKTITTTQRILRSAGAAGVQTARQQHSAAIDNAVQRLEVIGKANAAAWADMVRQLVHSPAEVELS